MGLCFFKLLHNSLCSESKSSGTRISTLLQLTVLYIKCSVVTNNKRKDNLQVELLFSWSASCFIPYLCFFLIIFFQVYQWVIVTGLLSYKYKEVHCSNSVCSLQFFPYILLLVSVLMYTPALFWRFSAAPLLQSDLGFIMEELDRCYNRAVTLAKRMATSGQRTPDRYSRKSTQVKLGLGSVLTPLTLLNIYRITSVIFYSKHLIAPNWHNNEVNVSISIWFICMTCKIQYKFEKKIIQIIAIF